MRENRMPECCTLPIKYNNCTRKMCANCGWNKDEREWRRLLLKRVGLVSGDDGVKALRLPMRKKEEEE